MKKSFGLALAAAATVLASQASFAGSDVGSIYVAPQIQGVWLDDIRNADDDTGFSFSIGYVASEKWDVEIAAFTAEHDALSNAKLRNQGFNLEAHRVFYRDASVTPFLSIGLGRIESALSGNPTEADFFAKYGVGVLADLAKNLDAGTNLQLRGEIFGRRAFSSITDDPTDYVASVGLQYSWGGAPPPPPPPADSDGDGVTDDMDKCPGTPAGTPVNADGCPLDSDGDGVIDPNDKCPNTPAGTRVDANGCELDSDGDGVVDSKDQCPNTPAGIKVDEKGCELDSDGDGVVDSKDECPNTPAGERVDFRGCPFTKEIQLPRVVFDTNSAELRPESFEVLDGAVSTLQRYSDIRVEVAGHTDSVGSDGYNQALSARRADTVLKYLQDKGVTNAVRARGYGERQPIASNATEEGRLANRRVVLRIIN
ncbi:MAG: OmpA family protein [Steroidobacteraceae bacterium]